MTRSRTLPYFLGLAVLLIILCLNVFITADALEWDGDSSGGGWGGSLDDDSYIVVYTPAERGVVGYRFTALTSDGYRANGASSVDIYIKNAYNSHAYDNFSSMQKVRTKYSKMDFVRADANGSGLSFSTSTSTSGCLKDNTLGFLTLLPYNPADLPTWQGLNANMDVIADLLGYPYGIDSMPYGDKIIVEPIVTVGLENQNCALTVTELATYGRGYYGNGNWGKTDVAGTFGAIGRFSNFYYPNLLFTPDGQGLWPGVSELSPVPVRVNGRYDTSGMASFNTIIRKGYGVGIAYSCQQEIDIAIWDIFYEDWYGNSLDKYSIPYGTGVSAYYTIYNDSDADVWVDVYGNYGEFIDTFWLSPWEMCTVWAGDFYAYESDVYYGAVYLSGYTDASMETDPYNNEYWDLYEVVYDANVTVEPIYPNSNYRAGKEVMTSFYVYNDGSVDITPDQFMEMYIWIYYDGECIFSDWKPYIVIPAWERNIVYFKWTVPDYVELGEMEIEADVYVNGMWMDYASFTTRCSDSENFQTPDTWYTDRRPSNWGEYDPWYWEYLDLEWEEWFYEDGIFYLEYFYAGIDSISPYISPGAKVPDAEWKNGVYEMKSGYSYDLYWHAYANVWGSGHLTDDMHTSIQTACALFPEFEYEYGPGKCRVLDCEWDEFYFPENPNAGGRLEHFIPIWYPDGEANYTINVCGYDLWTPVGMVYYVDVSNSFTIDGNMYDDYFIG